MEILNNIRLIKEKFNYIYMIQENLSYTTKHTPCELFQLPSASVSAQTGIHTNQIKISNKNKYKNMIK